MTVVRTCDYHHDGTKATWLLVWEGTGHQSKACDKCFVQIIREGVSPSVAVLL